MVVGFCGSGSMAAAMARGWVGAVDEMLFTDGGSGRATELAAEVGGRAVGSNAELAEAADVLVLAVKPARLGDVAAEIGELAKPLVSLLGATSLESVRAAFPGADVFRVMPNVAVEVRRGVLCVAGGESAEVRAPARPARQDGRAARLASSTPRRRSWAALRPTSRSRSRRSPTPGAEAGLDEALARELVVETTAGTAELLRDPPPGRRPPGRRLAGGQHRGRPRGARPRGRPRRLRRRGQGLAGEDETVSAIPLALTRDDVAEYVSALFLVYIVLILINVLLSWVPRMPYNRALCAPCVDFVTETTNPYINLFRRVPAADRRRRASRSTSAR